VQSAVTGDTGGYFFGSLFPGTYDLKVELSGFKTHEEPGIVISPNDTRGVDIRLEIGEHTETILVAAQQDTIQTATGAREGVLSTTQIDNLSVMGRSALELLRILPGIVTEFNVGEYSNGDTAAYTVNGYAPRTIPQRLTGRRWSTSAATAASWCRSTTT